MPAKKEIKVNLLPQKEFERSPIGRVLKWALSTFRIIVIVTEMLVMIAFLSRFWLDARNSDLNEILTQKKALILSYATTEKNFRDTQKRVEIFSKMTSHDPVSTPVRIAASYLPPDVQMTSLTQTENTIQISGTSASEQGIAQLVANLSSVESFKEVALTQISSDKENQSLLLFTVKVSI